MTTLRRNSIGRRWLLGGRRCMGWAYCTDQVVVRCEGTHGHKGKCDAPRYRVTAIAQLRQGNAA